MSAYLIRFAIFIAALNPPVVVHAVYKCGSTYSQTPCGENAKVIQIRPSMEVSDGQKLKDIPLNIEKLNIEYCQERLKIGSPWKDRDSLKFSPTIRSKSSAFVKINGKQTEVVPYITKVNAKNSYGAYAGDSLAVCYFDLNESKILDQKVFEK